MQQRHLNSAAASLTNILESMYIGNGTIDDIPIDKKTELNKFASKAITNYKNQIANLTEDKYREAGFPMVKQFVSDVSNLMGQDVDKTKIEWLQ